MTSEPEIVGARHTGDEEDIEDGKEDVNNGAARTVPQSIAFTNSDFLGPASALLYGVVAVAMGFINKAVISSYGLKESNVLLLFQQLTAIVVLRAVASLGLVVLEPLTCAQARKLLWVSGLYNANVGFALASLASLNVPMYMALKRLTPAFVLAANYLRGTSKPSTRVAASIITIVLGCLIAGYGDLSFDLTGYAFAFISCCLQAAYLLCVEHTGMEQGISSIDMLRYNALLSIIPLLLITWITGEADSARDKVDSLVNDGGFMVAFLSALLLGLLLNYSLFLCTELNSAQTTTVVGALKGVVTTALGFVLLGGVGPTSSTNIFGIVMNATGGVCYTYVKYIEKQSKVAYHRVSGGG